jgi:hypothetical protein
MPAVNQAALASVGIIAASVAVAAAIAIYESPEVRRMADDLRRRIAIALHSLGENVDPNRQPRFNRPEDADGFYASHDVDADEETRRRQREELMYWNALREEKEQQKQQEQPEPQQRSRGSSFDDFLQPDAAGERGTFVYNSGANAWNSESSNVLRRRGNMEGARGLDASILTNPFSDEYGIDLDDRPRLLDQHAALPPAHEEIMSDIYNATPRVLSPLVAHSQAFPGPVATEVLFDFESHSIPDGRRDFASPVGGSVLYQAPPQQQVSTPTATARSATLERELAEDEYMTAGQDYNEGVAASEAYASIQAWAQNSSNTGFYSPLPISPQAPLSEPELVSEGQLTPTGSGSVAGSGVDVANDAHDGVSEYDVMSESEGGAATPNSWSEVGSVVSEDEIERGRAVLA